MKMVTIEVTVLVDDDVSGEHVQNNVNAAIAHLDEYDDQAMQGYEWHDATVTSERPYAKED